MTALGVYRPGTSPLHRAPVSVKLFGMAVAIVAMAAWVTTVPRLGAAVALVVVVFAAGGIGPRAALAQLRAALWVVGLIFVFQLIITDWQRAVVVCAVLLASIGLAIAVTLTTRTVDIISSVERGLTPLRRVGVRTEQIALALALAIRAIPLLIELVRQVEEARQARNLPLRASTMLTPLVVAALRTADGFGETLIARGLD